MSYPVFMACFFVLGFVSGAVAVIACDWLNGGGRPSC